VKEESDNDMTYKKNDINPLKYSEEIN